MRFKITGYPPRYETLREMAEVVEKRFDKNNEDELQLVQYGNISKQWLQRFYVVTMNQIAHENALSIEIILGRFCGISHPCRCSAGVSSSVSIS